MLAEKVIAFRLVLAAILGGIIGIEREKNNRAAGFRTHILVSIGAALIMVISIDGYFRIGLEGKWDPARLSAQVVSGIGFLGAGTILQNDGKVDGLTTAASLWITAAIGLATGIGYYLPAVFSSGIVLLTLNRLKKVGQRIPKEYGEKVYLSFYEDKFDIKFLLHQCKLQGVKVNKVKINKSKDNKGQLKSVTLCLKFPENLDKKTFFNSFLASKKLEEINYINEEKIDEEFEYM